MGMNCRLENGWILSAILGRMLLWVMAAPRLQLEAYLTLIQGSTPQAAFTPYLPSLMASPWKSGDPTGLGSSPASQCWLELNFEKMGTWLPEVFLFQVP